MKFSSLFDKDLAVFGFIVAVLTLIVSVVGIVVTLVIFFLEEQDEPRYQIAYYFSEPSSASKGNFGFAGRPANEIRKVNLVIWNSGTEVISYNQVIEPVRVNGSDNVERIISKRRLGLEREAKANFSMPSHLSTNTQFVLQWEEFDPGAAIKIEISFVLSAKAFSVLNIFRATDTFQVSGEFSDLDIDRTYAVEELGA